MMVFNNNSGRKYSGLRAENLKMLQNIRLGFSLNEVREMVANVESLQDGRIYL